MAYFDWAEQEADVPMLIPTSWGSEELVQAASAFFGEKLAEGLIFPYRIVFP
jgi:hypothetical protein